MPPRPGKSAAAQNVRQYGFSLIVGGVRDSNFVQAMFAGGVREKSVTETPRGGLQIGFFSFGDSLLRRLSRNKTAIYVCAPKRQTNFSSTSAAASAKFVIEMQNAEGNAEVFLERDEQQQQGHRIRAARDRDAHAIAFADKATALNGALQSLR